MDFEPLSPPWIAEETPFGPKFLFKSAPKPPAAPDPAKTAAAQTASNKETAYWNAVLNNVNQFTPYGSLTYEQTGGGKQYNMDAYNKAMDAYNAPVQYQRTFNPATGVYERKAIGGKRTMPKMADFLISDAPPQFTSRINLTPEQQKIYETQTAQQQNLLDLGGEQMGRIGAAVSTPYSFSGIPALYGEGDLEGARKATEEAVFSRLNPQFQRDEEAMRSQLINQGVLPGSAAYNEAIGRLDRAKTDARMQAVLAGGNEAQRLFNQSLASRQQGITEYNTQRNAPLNEYIALTSGTQVQNPQFSNTSYQGAAPVDYAGLVNQDYQNRMGQYNAKVGQQNSLMNGLFGLGGSFLGGPGVGTKMLGFLGL